MKIYNLTIAYNDKTEEIEYIQETLEEDGAGECLVQEMVDEGFGDSISTTLIDQIKEIAEA